MMLVLREPLGVEKFNAIFVAQNLMLSAFECSDDKINIRANAKSFVSYGFWAICQTYILTTQWLKCYFVFASAQAGLENLALSRFHKAAVASLFEERN